MKMKTNLYKITDSHGNSCHGGTGSWVLGEWREAHGRLVPCKNGIHLCRVSDLTRWIAADTVVWRAEHKGKLIKADDKVVVRRARVVERIGKLTPKLLRRFACRCVRHTPLADGRTVWDLLKDHRLRKAVRVAEKYASGKATDSELAAAREGVWEVARTAPSAEVWAALGTTNRDPEEAAQDAAHMSAEAAWCIAFAASRTKGVAARAYAAIRQAQGDALLRLLARQTRKPRPPKPITTPKGVRR